MPCVCSTFSATRICSSRLALFAEPAPPLACQVLDVNCSPPWNPLPVLIPQFPPDSHCAMASQFTLYAGTGGGGGASGPGGGGASKPTGAGGGASGAGGGGGMFGSKPTGAGGGASRPGGGAARARGGRASGPGGGRASGARARAGTAFGSEPIGSAWAVADGMVTSVPVTAARMSVLRTLYKIVRFAVRAPKQAHRCGLKVLGSCWVGALGCAVSFRHSSGEVAGPQAGCHRPAAGGLSRPRRRSHAGPWINFQLFFRNPFVG